MACLTTAMLLAAASSGAQLGRPRSKLTTCLVGKPACLSKGGVREQTG